MLIFLFAVFDCKGTENFADMQVITCEMMIYWCDLYKKSLLHFLGIGVLQVRRPEGVRRNVLRVQRPKSPHFEESVQA